MESVNIGSGSPLAEEAPGVMNVTEEGKNVFVINDLNGYQGSSLEQKVDKVVETHGVVIVTRTWCPFSKDAKEFLGDQMCVEVHVIHINEISDGDRIFSYLRETSGHKTVPIIYIKGKLIGGCDQLKALHEMGRLEKEFLHDLIKRKRTTGTERLETSQLTPIPRSTAMMPFFWFPNTVNNHVVRLTGLQVFCVSVISCAFFTEIWARYLAVALLVDFALRMLAGSFVSPLGMIATVLSSPLKPNFMPGPPKQFASLCGLFFSLLGTTFYFVDFQGHEIIGAVWMGMLACAAGLEGFFNFCLGCLFFGYGIQFGMIPPEVYRIHTQTRQELVESWNYSFGRANAPVPIKVDTDPHNPIALKYKKKTSEWTKDDFDFIRNIQVSYFAMPMALAGLAVPFKIATRWSNLVLGHSLSLRTIFVPKAWFQVISFLAGLSFSMFLVLYGMRLVLYPHKCWIEWDCPQRSSGFGMVTITLMLFAFLMYDQINYIDSADEEPPQVFSRIIWWIGALGHVLLTVAKTGEWIGRRLELEHVHADWMIMPLGLGVAAFVAPIVEVFASDNGNSEENVMIARFFFSFAWLMWVTLFVITFLKVVTSHNTDNRLRHGVWLWLATPSILGLAEFVICLGGREGQCTEKFVQYYFIGIFLFLSFVYATLPHIAFFGRDNFGMGYWIECFSLSALAACACLFYSLNGWDTSQAIQFIALVFAAVACFCAFLHTLGCTVRRRGMFTPDEKFGPISFMKLTHEAFRANLPTLRYYIEAIDLDDDTPTGKENLHLFAAHFNRFRILHIEHSKHEDEAIFKTFNDFFPEHARKYNEDHAEDHENMARWVDMCNKLLDESVPVESRNATLSELRAELLDFFDHFEDHLRGEEDNLQPIAKKYLPIELTKQISRQVWAMTPADRWEIIIPFIINNLPRHLQRIRYLKILCWAMPERAQQIGAIVFRNVDAVMWERLRTELPEIIPRGAPHWKRYY